MTIDKLLLRNALGCFATGVCVVTVPARDGSDKPRGITVNSFSSVSLDPPLILWSLQYESESYQYFAGREKFAVNILNQDQQSLSQFYARSSGDRGLLPEHFRVGDSGLPIIHEAIASFECSLETTFEGGDHQILLGRIEQLHTGADEQPLVFFKGKYHTAAELPNG